MNQEYETSRVPHSDLELIVKECIPEFEGLEGKTVFLTGGTGFVGKWLLESILFAHKSLGITTRVFVLSRNPRQFLSNNPRFDHDLINYVKGNIIDFNLDCDRVDYIIHAGADASAELNEEQPELMLETVIEGTKKIIEVARTTSVSRILLTSSGAIYGKSAGADGSFSEDSPSSLPTTDVKSAYGEGKRVAELLGTIASRNYGVDFLIARLFAFVGPHLPIKTHYAIGNFIDDVLHERKITVKGDGTAIRSYMYAADLMIWLIKILVNGKSCSPYNVGSPNPVSIRELAETCGKLFGNEVEILGTPVPGVLPERYLPSTTKAREELNLRLYHSLEESIRKTVKWHRGQSGLPHG